MENSKFDNIIEFANNKYGIQVLVDNLEGVVKDGRKHLGKKYSFSNIMFGMWEKNGVYIPLIKVVYSTDTNDEFVLHFLSRIQYNKILPENTPILFSKNDYVIEIFGDSEINY